MNLRHKIIIFGILIIGIICCIVSICLSEFTEKEHVHCYDEWVLVSNPTCTAVGKRERFCSCGAKQESEIAELGHDIVSFDEKLADCTNGGYKAYEKCLRCDYSTYEETEPLGHDFGEWKEVKSPTCIDYGEKERVCSRDETHTETCSIAKSDHTPTSWLTETAATCINEGVEYIECSVCKIRLDSRTIEKTEHTPSAWITDKEPICGVVGLRHKECTVCGEELQTDEIDALEHSFEMQYDGEWHYLECEHCQAVKDRQPHQWGDNDCVLCDFDAGGIKGLEWKLGSDGNYILISAASVESSEFEIPSTHNGKSVTALSETALGGFRGESITVPSCITSIAKGAFSGCGNLREIIVPFIGYDRERQSHLGYLFGIDDFEDNFSLMPPSLKTVVISDGITELSENAFNKCTYIENIILPSTVEFIGSSCFYYCTELKKIELSANLKRIESGAFMGCSALASIEIPASVEEIAPYAFVGAAENISIKFNNKIGWAAYNGEASVKEFSETELLDENVMQTVSEYMKYTWKCKTSSSLIQGA